MRTERIVNTKILHDDNDMMIKFPDVKNHYMIISDGNTNARLRFFGLVPSRGPPGGGFHVPLSQQNYPFVPLFPRSLKSLMEILMRGCVAVFWPGSFPGASQEEGSRLPCSQQNFPCVPVFPRSLKVFLRFWCFTFPKIRHCYRVPSYIYLKVNGYVPRGASFLRKNLTI